MSFSSILSSNPADPPKPSTQKLPAVKQFQRKSHTPNGDTIPSASAKKTTHDLPPLPTDDNGSSRKPAKNKAHSTTTVKTTPGTHKMTVHAVSDKENEKVKKEMEKIDAMELSDIDVLAWAAKKEEHALLSQKRQLAVDAVEESKRKVSVTLLPSNASFL